MMGDGNSSCPLGGAHVWEQILRNGKMITVCAKCGATR